MMLSINKIKIQYGNDLIVEESDLVFPKGTITALIGESGSGKTSLLNEIVRRIEKDNELNFSYIMQDLQLIDDMSCFDHMDLISKNYGLELTNEQREFILNRVQLKLTKSTYPNQLSGGQRQRFLLALSLVKKSEIMVLDEITSSLDEVNTKIVLSILKEMASEGKIVIISSHNKEFFQEADRIYEIKDNKVQLIKNDSTIVEFVNDYSPKSNSTTGIKFVYLIKMFLRKIKHQANIYYIYLFILSIMVAVCGCGYYASNQFSEQEKATLKLFNDIPSYIYKSEDGSYFSDDDDGFDLEQINQIKSIDGVDEVYSFPIFSKKEFTRYVETLSDVEDHEFMNINVQSEKQNYTKEINISGVFGIQPYFERQNLDFSCSMINESVENGVYLHAFTAERLDITSLDEIVEIKLPIDVYVGKYYSDKYPSGTPVYKEIIIKKPVRGILDATYTYYRGNNIYMAYDEMDTLYKNTLASIEYNDELIQEDNKNVVLALFTNDKVKLDDVQANLRTIDPAINLDNLKILLKGGYASFISSEKYIFTYTIFIFAVTLLVSLIYTFINRKQFKKEIDWYKQWGIYSKNRKKILLTLFFVNSFLLSLCSILFNSLIFYSLYNKGILYYNVLTQYLFVKSYFVCFGLSILCSLCNIGYSCLKNK